MIAILPRDSNCNILELFTIIDNEDIHFNGLTNEIKIVPLNKQNRLIVYGHPNETKDCILNSDFFYSYIQGINIQDFCEYQYVHICWGNSVLQKSRFGTLLPKYVSYKESHILWLNDKSYLEFHKYFFASLHKIIYETEFESIIDALKRLIISTIEMLKKDNNSVEDDLRIAHLLFPFIKQYIIL